MKAQTESIQADSFRARVHNLDYFGNGTMAYMSGVGPSVTVLFSSADLEGGSRLHIVGTVVDSKTLEALENAEVFSKGYTTQPVKIYSPDGKSQEDGIVYKLDSTSRVVADRSGKFDVRLTLDSNTQVIFAKAAYFVAVYDFGKLLKRSVD